MLTADPARALLVAQALQDAFQTGGIFGTTEMPEDMQPPGVEPGSEEHLRFITLTVAIDYQRDADQLWDAARRTYADPDTRYLFDPVSVANTGLLRLVDDMRRYGLSRKHQNDPQTWQRVCTTLTRDFGGHVRTLLERAGMDAPGVLELIRSRRYRDGFPFLKGPKIGPLWVRMLYDNCKVPLKYIADVDIPVDIHTAQATLQTGCVRTGPWRGTLDELRQAVSNVWRQALTDPESGAYPLRMDEPLWLLSRRGCRATSAWPCEFLSRCPVAQYCEPQHVWLSVEGNVNQDGTECTIRPR